MKTKNGIAMLLTVGVIVALGVTPAGRMARAAEADTNELADIVVTAQRTSEPLSKVPISIAVVSGATLADENITDYADLSRAVPNVSFTTFGGPGQSNIEIRGVSLQAGSATTGIYLDDVPISVLNIYTQPDLNKVSGSVHSSVGGTQGGGVNYEGDSVINLPLVDGVAALRIGALYDHESGWIDRASPDGGIVARNINDVNTAVIRATVKIQPTEALTITPSVFLQRVTAGGQDLFGLSLPDFESPTLVAETSRDEFAITSLTVNYDFGWSDLPSVSGFFSRRDDRNIDGTVYDSQYLGSSLQQEFGYGGAAISALAAPVQFNTGVNQFHQEVRLASKPQGPDDHWAWIGGVYYSRTRTSLLDNEHIPGLTSTFESVYGDTPQNLLGASFPDDLIYCALSEFVNTEKAVFGQVTYTVLPGLKVTAGARYEEASEGRVCRSPPMAITVVERSRSQAPPRGMR